MADSDIHALSALTGANLAAGDEFVLVDVSDTTMSADGTNKKITATELAAGLSARSELAYAEFTSPVSITATVEASADSVVSAGAVTFDGSTEVFVEFFCPAARPAASASVSLEVWLFDGSSSIGRIALINSQAANNANTPVEGRRRLTPSAASHTYSVRATVTSGTGSVTAGAGGAGNYVPGYIRIVTT